MNDERVVASTQVIGSGYDGGVLTITGAVAEGGLLLGALALVIVTRRGASGPAIRGRLSH